MQKSILVSFNAHTLIRSANIRSCSSITAMKLWYNISHRIVFKYRRNSFPRKKIDSGDLLSAHGSHDNFRVFFFFFLHLPLSVYTLVFFVRPLRRVTVSASVNRQASPTKQLSSPDSMVAGAAGEGDSPGRSHGKAQRTSSAPSAW